MRKIVSVLLSVVVSGLLGILPAAVAFASFPAISNTEESGITENTAVISWTTDIVSTGQVRYGTAPATYTVTVASVGGTGTSHLSNLTGLAADTTYYYVIDATDSGDTTTSAEGSFTTKAFTISGITSSSITSNSATITWNTNVLATSNVDYGQTTGYGSAAPASADASADSLSHSVVLSSLSPSTLYHYRVKSIDGSANEEMSVDYTFTTLADAPPVISNVQPNSITVGGTTSATISWDTNEAANSQVEYGTASSTHGNYALTSALDATLVTSHSVLIGGLTQNTKYYYRAISTDTYTNQSVSAEYWFNTAADTTQPVISSVASSSVTTTSATISWGTDENSDSTVDYGTTVAYGSSKTSAALVTSHQIVLTGLTPNTMYHYRVRSTDAYTNEVSSVDYTFTTLADSTSPVISDVQTMGITGSSVTVTWATNEAASSQLDYGLTDAYGSQTVLDANLVTSHSVSIGGLADGTTFHFRVKSADAAGNPALSTDSTFVTLDVTAPTAPSNLVKTTANKDNTPIFTWNASTDASSGVDHYDVRIDGGAWASIGNVVTYTIATGDALADGAHTIDLRALDVAGNPGAAASLGINIDATAPTAVTELAKSSADSINTPQFNWTAATDVTSAISYYQVKIDSEDWSDIANVITYIRATALVDGGYTFHVRAVDAAGNTGVEATVDFTIDTVAPAVPVNVAVTTGTSDTTPTFTWDAATDVTSSIASYKVRIGDGDFSDIGNVTEYTVGEALAVGSYDFEVRAVDTAGNVGTAGTASFTIEANRLSVGALIGIILGSLAAVVAAVAWSIVIIRRKKRRLKQSTEL